MAVLLAALYQLSRVYGAVVVLPTAFLVVAALANLWHQLVVKRGGPAGIPLVAGNIPYFGSLEYIRDQRAFHKKFAEMGVETYCVYFFGSYHTAVSHPLDINAFFKARDDELGFAKAFQMKIGFMFPKIPKDEPKAVGDRTITEGATGPHAGQMFAPVLHLKLLRKYFATMLRCFNERVLPELKEGELDLFPFMRSAVLRMTLATMAPEMAEDEWMGSFDKLFDRADPEQVFTLRRGLLTLLTEIPWFAAERSVYAKIKALYYPLIEAHWANLRGAPDDMRETHCDCILDALLIYWKRRGFTGDSMPIDRVYRSIYSLTFAAISNTYASAAWVTYHLAHGKHHGALWIERALRELDDLVASENLTLDIVESAHFLESMVLEVGRLYTPGDFFRLAEKDFQLPHSKTVVPRGHYVLMSAHTLFRRALDIPPDKVEVFDPENSERPEAKDSPLLVPFGRSAHPCTGRRFAMMEIRALILTIHKTFHVELVDKTGNVQLDQKQLALIWRPAGPLRVKLTKKQQTE